jgi:ubiquinone biosynthesis monooxygenase Coq7
LDISCLAPLVADNPLDCQSVYNPAIDQVFSNDFFYITLIYIGIPDRIRVHDHYRTLFASVQASGRIDADTPLAGYTQFLTAPLGEIPHAQGIKTLAARATVSTQIGTEKYVITIVRHRCTIQEQQCQQKRQTDRSSRLCYLRCMAIRNLNFVDRCILQFDQAVRTLFSEPPGSGRENPAQSLENGEISATERADSICLMRVNHAGEVCAQALYQGQALTAHDHVIREQLQQAAIEENDHLIWCRQRIEELGGQTSLLNPLWYTGSLMIGAATGFLGDKWSLGFLAETEHQVVEHLDNHLQRLPETDNKSHAILEQMKTDEAKHKTAALHSGGAVLPAAVKKLMGLTARIMTRTAYRI